MIRSRLCLIRLSQSHQESKQGMNSISSVISNKNSYEPFTRSLGFLLLSPHVCQNRSVHNVNVKKELKSLFIATEKIWHHFSSENKAIVDTLRSRKNAVFLLKQMAPKENCLLSFALFFCGNTSLEGLYYKRTITMMVW